MRPKSSLLIMTEDSPESYSPAGERVRHMALASRPLFENVLVLTLHGVRKPTKPKKGSNLLLYTVNFTRAAPFPISSFFDPVKFVMLLVHGLAQARHYKPSLIVVSMPPLEAGMSGWFLAKLLRVKLIVDLRDDWESAIRSKLTRYIPFQLIKILSRFAREIYSFSVNISVVTQSIADAVHKRGIATPTILVPNGADTAIFLPKLRENRIKTRQKYALPPDKILMICSGSGINPYYRLDLLLLSMRSLPSEMTKKLLLVFYLYNGIERLRDVKARLRISDELVEIRGPLPRRNLAEILASCDVGLVPFDDNPYLLCARSTKLYEYLSTGLYVISSGPKGGELDAFFSPNPQLGYFTQPAVEDFVDAFLQVVENAENLFGSKYRNLRHSFIRENYDRQKIMTKSMETAYTDIRSR